ncbi:MAG: hypothetical protein HC821_01440 [Lewinella sp.]|nr:hypothetical protein [Lewinella sp.]
MPMKEFNSFYFSLAVLFAATGTWLLWPTTAVVAEPAPARELRGVWMASVVNIDYPQSPTVDPATLQADFRSQLMRLKKIGVNAVFVSRFAQPA